MRVCLPLHLQQHWSLFIFTVMTILTGVRKNLKSLLLCISLTTKTFKHLFQLLGHFYFFWELSIHWFIYNCVVYCLYFYSYLHILDIDPPSNKAGKDFPPFCRLLFTLVTDSPFAGQDLISCNPACLFLRLYTVLLESWSESLPVALSWSVFPVFSNSGFAVSGHTLQSLIYFELIIFFFWFFRDRVSVCPSCPGTSSAAQAGWTDVLCRVRDVDLVWVFYQQRSRVPRTIY